jgi:hypothetical protein
LLVLNEGKNALDASDPFVENKFSVLFKEMYKC